MKRIMKIGAIAFGILLVILIALPLLINVNSFRPKIESELAAALGRQVPAQSRCIVGDPLATIRHSCGYMHHSFSATRARGLPLIPSDVSCRTLEPSALMT